MEQNIELRQVRDFGELVNDTIVFFKQNWKPLLKAFFLIGGFFLVAGMIAAVINQQRMVQAMAAGGIPKNPFSFYGIEAVVSMIFTMLSYISITLVTFCYISLYKDKGNQPPATEEVWSYFKYFFLRFFGSQIVLSLLMGIGFVLCFFPGIYLMPIVSLMTAIIVFENSSLGYAFDRSFKLIKENWWTTFGAIVIIIFMVYALAMVFILPLSVITGVSMFVTKFEMPLIVIIATTIIQYLCQALLILPCIAIALCYFSLVEKKEGTSLMDKIDQIGKDDLASGLPEEQY